MNKLFTKIASLTLGLALAAGAGAFLGRRAAEGVSAAEKVAYTLDGTVTGGSSGYDSESDISQGDISWKVTGNTTMNPWRIGGKSLTNVDRTAYSTTAMSNTITKVELTVGTASSITVNSLKLLVSTSSSFSPTVEEVSKTFAADSTITFEASEDWTNCYYKFIFNVTVSGTSNKFVQFKSAVFYEESAVARGEASINGLDSSMLFVGGSKTLTAGWDPLDSGATVSSYSFTSSDTDVLSFSGNTLNAVAPGKAKVTLNLTDSNSEEYVVVSDVLYVSNSYEFDIGDTVVLYSEDVTMEMTEINKSGSTHYGVGTAYVGNPNGTYLLTVEEGTVSGSLSFVNDSNYLCHTGSSNSLSTSTTKSENSSWYVIYDGSTSYITNVASPSRQIWWNNLGTALRFATYENKTAGKDNIVAVNLMKIEEAPVRGTIAINTSFEKATRQGIAGTLSFTWTPAEESSATIVSHSWTSSNSDVISVSGDAYEAIGPGKAKITLNATDSNGQLYEESTIETTVVSVVSGSYVKYESISNGDTVTFVCESAGTQISNVKSNIGEYVFYDVAPASVFDFTAVANGDLFAFVSSDGKYLTWGDATKADIKLLDEPTSKSYWSVAFDEGGNAIVTNNELDGETHRYLAWNDSSPRFAAYKTGQTPIQLYGPSQEIVISENGLAFINNLLSYTCDEDGKTAPSPSVWSDLNTRYNATGDGLIPTEDKDLFKSITAVEHKTPVTTREKVEQAMAKYDYIVGKYNKTLGKTEEYLDFIERDPAPLKNIRTETIGYNSTNTAIIVVSVIAIVSVSSIGVLLVLKRRKNHI